MNDLPLIEGKGEGQFQDACHLLGHLVVHGIPPCGIVL